MSVYDDELDALDELGDEPLADEPVYIDEESESALEPLPQRSLETPCSFLCGSAGTGKTFTLKQRIAEDPCYAVLSASTGISAVNLNTTTIHSLLGYFDTDSLRDAYLKRSAQYKLHSLRREGYRNVVIDEISMISCEQLDVIVHVFDDVNQNTKDGEEPLGLVLCGDFCQLPSIPERSSSGRKVARAKTPWAFDARSWLRFGNNITRLTKVWRQGDAEFLSALNHARRGNGSECASLLASSVEFFNMTDRDFDGTTILSQNAEVDRANQLALDRIRGRKMLLPSRRWGKQRSEWKNIPDQTVLREGAYVMLLANNYSSPGVLEYANGDCGHVLGIEQVGSDNKWVIAIELVRNKQIVYVPTIVRGVELGERPNETVEQSIAKESDDGRYIAKVHYRGRVRRYVIGQIEYYPIRLAYASTVHKIQGLSLDRCQIDFRSWMFGSPAMLYVSLSRCRTLQGLRLVGDKDTLARKCKIDPRVLPWL
jgi:hypothetical protein